MYLLLVYETTEIFIISRYCSIISRYCSGDVTVIQPSLCSCHVDYSTRRIRGWEVDISAHKLLQSQAYRYVIIILIADIGLTIWQAALPSFYPVASSGKYPLAWVIIPQKIPVTVMSMPYSCISIHYSHSNQCLLQCCLFFFLTLCGLQWIPALQQRRKIRKRLHHKESSGCRDCIESLCCMCCVLVQHKKELDDLHRSGRSAPGAPVYRSPAAMTLPNMRVW